MARMRALLRRYDTQHVKKIRPKNTTRMAEVNRNRTAAGGMPKWTDSETEGLMVVEVVVADPSSEE